MSSKGVNKVLLIAESARNYHKGPQTAVLFQLRINLLTIFNQTLHGRN